MPDVLTPAQRHRCMSHIRSKATKPEISQKKDTTTCAHQIIFVPLHKILIIPLSVPLST